MATATYNSTVTSTAAPAGEVGQTISHVALWDDTSRTNLIMTFALTSTQSALTLGQSINIAANAWVWTFTSTQLFAFGERECLHGIFRANRYLSYHTGNPGGSGTSNRRGGMGMSTLNSANFTYA